jgi:triosephosphate isomerase
MKSEMAPRCFFFHKIIKTAVSERITIVINFKKLTGKQAHDLMVELNEYRNDDRYEIILALQANDAVIASSVSKFKIFIQDIFSSEEECFTRYFRERSRARIKVAGVLLNHPEKKLASPALEESVETANKLNLSTLICATTIDEAIALRQYSPKYIGIEDARLIGRDISFRDCNPEIVTMAKSKIETDILIGAGIRTEKDLQHVITTGGSGILVSSLILRSENPLQALVKLLN